MTHERPTQDPPTPEPAPSALTADPRGVRVSGGRELGGRQDDNDDNDVVVVANAIVSSPRTEGHVVVCDVPSAKPSTSAPPDAAADVLGDDDDDVLDDDDAAAQLHSAQNARIAQLEAAADACAALAREAALSADAAHADADEERAARLAACRRADTLQAASDAQEAALAARDVELRAAARERLCLAAEVAAFRARALHAEERVQELERVRAPYGQSHESSTRQSLGSPPAAHFVATYYNDDDEEEEEEDEDDEEDENQVEDSSDSRDHQRLHPHDDDPAEFDFCIPAPLPIVAPRKSREELAVAPTKEKPRNLLVTALAVAGRPAIWVSLGAVLARIIIASSDDNSDHIATLESGRPL